MESLHLTTLTLYRLDGPGSQGQGAHWKAWVDALKKPLLDHQEAQGANRGSWMMGDPTTSTSLATLALEVYYRYANALGTQRR